MDKRGVVRGDRLYLPAVELEIPVHDLLQLGATGEHDIVMAGGSLIEGVGNEFSDLDLYVISDHSAARSGAGLSTSWRAITRAREILRQGSTTPADGDGALFLLHVPLGNRYMKVDFEFRTESETMDLGRQVALLYEYATQNLELFTKPVDERDRMLIHRLHTGVALNQAARASALIERLDAHQFSYILYRMVASDFSMVLDALGAWNHSRLADCALLMRDKLMFEMSGLLSLSGVWVTNPKWLLSYLQQVADRQRRFPVPGFDSLRARFVELFAAMQWTHDAAYRDYVLRSADLMDDLYDATAGLLAERGYPCGEAARRRLRESIKDTGSTRYAALELEHRLLVYAERRRPLRNLFLDGAF